MCYNDDDDDDDHDDDDNDDDDNDDGDDDNEDDDHDHHDDGDDDDDGDMLFADTVWLVTYVKRNSLDSWADSAVDSVGHHISICQDGNSRFVMLLNSPSSRWADSASSSVAKSNSDSAMRPTPEKYSRCASI